MIPVSENETRTDDPLQKVMARGRAWGLQGGEGSGLERLQQLMQTEVRKERKQRLLRSSEGSLEIKCITISSSHLGDMGATQGRRPGTQRF